MKTKITKSIAIILLALFGLSNNLNAQTLFKDLYPGALNSQPDQFMNVNGTMYFHTYGTTGHGLWKSDGTAANTVIVKDSIIGSNATNAAHLIANVGDTLYYTVNKMGATAGDTTRLWKTYNGSAPVLVATLAHTIPTLSSVVASGYPSDFTVVGNKLFFSMGTANHGRELWVSDGTAAGTFEVIDLDPGNQVGIPYGGLFVDNPMVAFNGKVYFRGTIQGNDELYSSDGTLAGTTLVKEINPSTNMSGGSNPGSFIVYNNELYFSATDGTNTGMFKTDGTAAGTVYIGGSFGNAKIFQNKMYYFSGRKLWKSDGTNAGTVLVKDSADYILGMNNNYLFLRYNRPYLSVPPAYYYKSDGTTAGTVQVSDSLGRSASFAVLNNKMYTGMKALTPTTFIYGLWETDGTEAGTKQFLPGNSVGDPFVFNNTVFFKNYETATGIELWYYNPGTTSVDERNTNQLPSVYTLQQNYPNPFNPSTSIEFQIPQSGFVTLNIFDLLGKEVATLVNEEKKAGSYSVNFDASHLSSGIYFYTLKTNNFIQTKKMILLK